MLPSLIYFNQQPYVCSPCRPDLIEFENLKRSNAHYNLQNAFNVSEKELGLTKLLDPEGECINSAHTQNDKRNTRLGSVRGLTLTAEAKRQRLLVQKRLMGVRSLED